MTSVGLDTIRPRAVATAFDGAGVMTVIEVGIVLPAERDLAVSCVLRAAAQPPHRGDGLVFHASDLRRANIYELIEEAVL